MNAIQTLLTLSVLFAPLQLTAEPTTPLVLPAISFTLPSPHFLPVVVTEDPVVQVEARIRKLSRYTPAKRAHVLAKAFVAAGRRTGVDPMIMVALCTQESRFRGGLKSEWTNRGQVTHDYGVMQVNEHWIEAWGLDAQRLQFDDAYNIQVAARILKGLQKKYAATERQWYTRYNSSWAPARAKYTKAITPFLTPSLFLASLTP